MHPCLDDSSDVKRAIAADIRQDAPVTAPAGGGGPRPPAECRSEVSNRRKSCVVTAPVLRGRSAVSLVGAALLLLTSAVLTPAAATTSPTTALSSGQEATIVPASSPMLGFVGRWERHYAGDEAATVNSGSLVRLRFTGQHLTGLFDVSTITVPPQLYVTVDGGPESLVTVDRPEIELMPAGLRPGEHTVRIDVKDTDQVTNRWLPPLGDAVIVRGFRLAAGEHLLAPPKPADVRMTVYGDSITEGIRALGQPLTPDRRRRDAHLRQPDRPCTARRPPARGLRQAGCRA